MLGLGDETADQYNLLGVRKTCRGFLRLGSMKSTDHFDTIIHDQLSRDCGFAVATSFSREIDNDRSRFHGFHHLRTDQNHRNFPTGLITYLLCDQFRSWSAGNQCSCDDNVDVPTLFHEKFHLRFDELFRHFFGVATLTSAVFFQVHLDEFSTE